jgi:hypothetical protein
MEERKQQFQIITRVGGGFFVNLSAGYFFALALSPSPLVLTDNLILCILTLYIAYYFERLSRDE